MELHQSLKVASPTPAGHDVCTFHVVPAAAAVRMKGAPVMVAAPAEAAATVRNLRREVGAACAGTGAWVSSFMNPPPRRRANPVCPSISWHDISGRASIGARQVKALVTRLAGGGGGSRGAGSVLAGVLPVGMPPQDGQQHEEADDVGDGDVPAVPHPEPDRPGLR